MLQYSNTPSLRSNGVEDENDDENEGTCCEPNNLFFAPWRDHLQRDGRLLWRSGC
jgi:hypothetical protein